jgi:clostripain
MCPDEQSGRDMGIAELTDDVGPAEHVDFLALELCNMGGIEIAYQWRAEEKGGGRFGADVLLAIPNAGPPLDWDLAFKRIRSPGHDCHAERPPFDPAEMTAADFGRLVIEEGYEGRLAHARRGGRGASESAAAYDLRAAGGVKESVDALARALAASDSRAAFGALREGADDAAMNYSGDGPFVDLYDVCARAASSGVLSEEVRAAAASAMERVDAFVIASFGMDDYKGFEPGRHGVFITLPAPGRWASFKWYTPGAGAGRDYGRWAFLRDGATEGNGKVESWFELLDSWYDEAGGGANGYRP